MQDKKLPSYNDMVLKYWYKYNFDDFLKEATND